MIRCTKKPVEFEAMKWDSQDPSKFYEWFAGKKVANGNLPAGCYIKQKIIDESRALCIWFFVISSLKNNDIELCDGDYLVRGDDKSLVAHSPAGFEKLYVSERTDNGKS